MGILHQILSRSQFYKFNALLLVIHLRITRGDVRETKIDLFHIIGKNNEILLEMKTNSSFILHKKKKINTVHSYTSIHFK